MPDQILILQNLANKCPYQDGPGVYKAREILAEYNNEALTVYTDDCSGGRGVHRPVKKASQQNPNNQINVSIYPNPNNGNFTLKYNLGNETSGKVLLYDEIGEKVGEYDLSGSSGEMQISNSNLINGIYVYKVYTNNSIIKVGKIIVIK